MTASSEPSFPERMVDILSDIACDHGAGLSSRWLLPATIQRCAASEFERGVLACVAEIYWLILRSPECREAIRNLGLEPVSEDVERPGCGGRDD